MADDEIDALLSSESEPDPAPEPEPAPEPAPEPEPGKEPEPEPKPQDTVPIAALHEERERRRELQGELRQTGERMARMEALYEQLQKPKADDAPLPSYEDDPEGHLRGTVADLQKRVAAAEGQAQERGDQERTTSEQQQVLQSYAASVRNFQRDNSDFQEAYQYLSDAADQELQARGFDDPVERTNAMQYEEGLLVGRAVKAGKDPAEVIYNYAKFRGWKGQADDNKIVRLQKGEAAARSLSGAGGKGEATLTLERLSELADEDPEAFDREWLKAQRAGLLG